VQLSLIVFPENHLKQWSYDSSDNSIRLANSSYCLDVYNCQTDDGTVIQSFDCHAGGGCDNGAGQAWTLNSDSSLTVTLNGQKRCLDVYDFAGPNVELYDCNGGANQKWTFNSDGTLTSAGKCLDLAGSLEVWAGPLSDGSKAVILFNRSSGSAKITASWSDIGISAGTSCDVRDLWQRKSVGTFKDSFSATVASHGVVMVKISPK